jgi:hypothetical protein
LTSTILWSSVIISFLFALFTIHTINKFILFNNKVIHKNENGKLKYPFFIWTLRIFSVPFSFFQLFIVVNVFTSSLSGSYFPWSLFSIISLSLVFIILLLIIYKLESIFYKKRDKYQK